MTATVKVKDRKIHVLVGFTQAEITFLDRKVDKKHPELASRSAILRALVRCAMLRPAMLDR